VHLALVEGTSDLQASPVTHFYIGGAIERRAKTAAEWTHLV